MPVVCKTRHGQVARSGLLVAFLGIKILIRGIDYGQGIFIAVTESWSQPLSVSATKAQEGVCEWTYSGFLWILPAPYCTNKFSFTWVRVEFVSCNQRTLTWVPQYYEFEGPLKNIHIWFLFSYSIFLYHFWPLSIFSCHLRTQWYKTVILIYL